MNSIRGEKGSGVGKLQENRSLLFSLFLRLAKEHLL